MPFGISIIGSSTWEALEWNDPSAGYRLRPERTSAVHGGKPKLDSLKLIFDSHTEDSRFAREKPSQNQRDGFSGSPRAYSL
jgi:hypothetical protein